MNSKRVEGPEAIVAPLYFLAFLLTATPVLDFVQSVMPFRPETIEWRFASVGLLSGFVLTPLLGVVLAMVVAYWAGHVRFQRILSIINGVVAVAFLVILAFFLLDVFQLKNSVQDEALEAFKSAASKATIKHLSFIASLGWLAIGGFRMSRWTAAEPKRQASAVVIG